MKKLYFKSIDETFCLPLEDFMHDAKIEGLKEINLIEALPDKDTFFTWCSEEGEVVGRNDCKKSSCELYRSNKSGRGACIHRGKLYKHGEEVVFNVV